MINRDKTFKGGFGAENVKLLLKVGKSNKLIPILYLADNALKSFEGFEEGILLFTRGHKKNTIPETVEFIRQCKRFVKEQNITFKNSHKFKKTHL